MYQIIDGQTRQVVGTAKTLKAACRSVDRRDNTYGAVRYFHRRVPTLPEINASLDPVPAGWSMVEAD